MRNWLGGLIVLLMLSAGGCSIAPPSSALRQGSLPTLTPFQPIYEKEVTLPPEAAIKSSPVPSASTGSVSLWIDEAVPDGVRQALQQSGSRYVAAGTLETAALRLGVVPEGGSQWIYALVAPFPTVEDGVTLVEALRTWRGEGGEAFGGRPLWMDSRTRQAFEAVWGKAADSGVRVVETSQLLQAAWEERPAWALVPFEALDPRWKALQIDGMSPLDRDLDLTRYPLTVHFGVVSGKLDAEIRLPLTNRDPQRMTALLMTGVTALVRATGAKMETHGMQYPAQDILAWFEAADLVHISNEVSFDADCPLANPYQKNLRFCSRNEYVELFTHIGADIVELTGNHLVDWRRESLVESLALYRQRGMQVYGAGTDLAEARRPLLVEHNGNRRGFLGCNPAGPPNVWANAQRAGAAACEDYGWIKEEIARLRSQGYLPVVTLQYHETYALAPTPYQVRDFPPLAEAGAVIVSGSQAHYPHGMTFVEDRLIHFGLGNLFFDQMFTPTGLGTPLFNPVDLPVAGTRLGFLDRHVFYDGRYISAQLLTTMLEDYAKPRPLTAEERAVLLRDTFRASGW
ncbi:MAG: CapA family protein [Anaerolineaceae bacterium]|nr:CapA family protein [Anaerolineaceae bacterium]